MVVGVIGALLVGACLGLLGSGGAILTVPILVYLVGRPEKEAIAESLAIVGIIAAFGAARNMRAGTIDLKRAAAFGGGGIAGALLGAFLADFVPGPAQVFALAVVMLAAAALMARPTPSRAGDAEAPRVNPLLVALIGCGVGIMTGLLGVGGGFLIVPALVLLVGLPMKVAVGTSLAVITLNCAVAFGKTLAVRSDDSFTVDWTIIALFGAVGIVGSVVGARVGSRLNQKALKKVFAVFLVVMAGYMLFRQWPKVFPPEGGPEAAQSALGAESAH